MPSTLPRLPDLSSLSPADQARYKALVEAVERDQEKARCEASLFEFFKRAWQEIDPAPFEENWHHHEICAQLEALARGEVRDLVVNIPPRTGKSNLITTCFPAWMWVHDRTPDFPLIGPHCSFLTVSYGAVLAEVAAVKMRRLVMGEWYQKLWGDKVRIREDQASRSDFGNYAGGERISASIEGGILGRGALCVTGGTIVQTSHGATCVAHLDKSTSPCYILSYDSSRKAPSYRRLIAVSRRKENVIYRVHTRHGHVVEATGDHPFFTRRGWVQAVALVVGDVLLRCVREGIDSSGRRDGQVGEEPEGWALLQPDLRHHPKEPGSRASAARVPGMWGAAAAEGGVYEPFLRISVSQKGIREIRSSEDDDTTPAVRDLRDHVPAEEQHNAGPLLLPEMQGQGAFGGNEREEEPRVFARAGEQLWAASGLVCCEAAGLGSGPVDVRGLWGDGSVAGTPHKLNTDRPSPGELGVPMRDTSSGTSRSSSFYAESDAVSLVERVCRKGNEDVFDLQIEGTECFFANGILVHNCQIIDDPHKLDAVESDLERARTIRAIKEGLTTRITDPRISARILVMQRLHTADATDYALKNWRQDLRHIMLPMRYEPDRACFCDPRTDQGELLWPQVWTEEAVSREETELGPYGAAGQLQQAPTPRGGGIIKQEWIEGWPPLNPDGSFPQEMVVAGRIQYPMFEYLCACVDTAFTSKQTADRSAMAVMGVFRASGKGGSVIERGPDGQLIRVSRDDHGYPKIMLVYGWAKRLDLRGPPDEKPPDMTPEEWNSPGMRTLRQQRWGLVEWVVDTCKRYKVDHLQILTLGQGHGLEQELQLQHWDNPWTVGMEVERGDKLARAYRGQHFFSGKQVYAPQFENGTYPSWCDPLIRELTTFPMGDTDDFVDAAMGCLRHLRAIGILERREEFESYEDQIMLYRPGQNRVELPYPV